MGQAEPLRDFQRRLAMDTDVYESTSAVEAYEYKDEDKDEDEDEAPLPPTLEKMLAFDESSDLGSNAPLSVRSDLFLRSVLVHLLYDDPVGDSSSDGSPSAAAVASSFLRSKTQFWFGAPFVFNANNNDPRMNDEYEIRRAQHLRNRLYYEIKRLDPKWKMSELNQVRACRFPILK